MLKIDENTTKKQLLNDLARNSNSNLPLVIFVENLPNFLATNIAFTIFTYQISNYPREILWDSQNPRVLEVLAQTDVRLATPQTLSPAKNLDFTNHSLVSTPTNVQQILTPTNLNNFGTQRFFSSGLDDDSDSFPQFDTSRLIPTNFLEHQADFDKVRETNNKVFLESNRHNPLINKNIQTIGSSQTVGGGDYQSDSSSLGFDQNLDSWIDKIESTRQALSKIQSKQKTVKRNHFSKILAFFSFSLLIGITSTLAFVFFPTSVYSLEIKSYNKSLTSFVKFSKADFSTKQIQISSDSSVPTTGSQTKEVAKSVGKVTLINNSSGEVKFDKNGIILVASNGKEYRHIGKNSEPTTIVVPPKSNLNDKNVVIDVEASQVGQDSNLELNSTLKIFNLQKAALGSSFSGVVTEAVSTSKNVEGSVVDDKDLASLKSKLEKINEQKIGQEIKNIQNNQAVYTNNSWLENIGSSITYSNKTGQLVSELSANSKTEANLYFLNFDTITNKLKQKNSEIVQVNNVEKLEDNGVSIVLNNDVNLEIKYSYVASQIVDDKVVADTLSQKEFSIAKDQIKSKYPGIVNIVQENNFNVPGINPRVKVEKKYIPAS